MKHDEIVHPWPMNINTYEQTFLGLSMTTLMVAGVTLIALFVTLSQTLGGLAGMLLGALLGAAGAGVVVLALTELALFNEMTLPVYLWRRFQARHDTALAIPLIVPSGAGEVIFEDWQGEEQGAIE